MNPQNTRQHASSDPVFTFGDVIVTVDGLAAIGVKALDQRIAKFTKVHSRPPSEHTTLREWFMVSPRPSDRMWLVIRVLAPIYPEFARAINRACVQTATASVKPAAALVRAATPRDYTAGYAVDAASAWLGTPSEVNRGRAYTAALHADRAARQADADSLGERVVSAIDACGWAARAAANEFNDSLFYAHATVRTVEYELSITTLGSGASLDALINELRPFTTIAAH